MNCDLAKELVRCWESSKLISLKKGRAICISRQELDQIVAALNESSALSPLHGEPK